MFPSPAAVNRRAPSCDIASYNHSLVIVPHGVHLGVSCADAAFGSQATVDPLGHLAEFCPASRYYRVHHCLNLHSGPS